MSPPTPVPPLHPPADGEGLCRLLLESMHDYAVVLLDPDGRVTRWSAGAARIHGYDEQQVRGEHFSRFFTPEAIERGEPERELRTAAEAGRAESETWQLRRDGSRFWASGVTTALRDADGTLLGFGKVARDLTGQHAVDTRLRLLESVIAHAEDAVLITEPVPLDEPGPVVVFANEAFTRMTGYSAAEMIGRNPRILQGPGTDRAATGRIRAALEGGARSGKSSSTTDGTAAPSGWR